MTIRAKTPLEQTALHFKSAGLGDRSATEAARLLLRTGISFETAAVAGQRLDEACTATPATIREAASRYRRANEAPRTTTAWGRPVQEAAAESNEPAAATAYGRPIAEASDLQVTPTPRPAMRGKQFSHPERTKEIDGVLHHEVITYEYVDEQEKPTRTPWGRKLED